MIILINTSKTLDFKTKSLCKDYSLPKFLNKSNELIDFLKTKNQNELSIILKTNEKLTKLNYERIHNWSINHNITNSKQAIFSFTGTVFKGFYFDKYTNLNFSNMQAKIRILSGLYGILKPFDLIQPYRLEMATKLNDTLSDFWKNSVTTNLNNENTNFILNLASNEYTNSIDMVKLKYNLITPIFKNSINGKIRTIAIYSKQMRGFMANHIIKNNIDSIGEIKSICINDYEFNEKLSNSNILIFIKKI